MLVMNLHEWDNLSIDARKKWLEEQSLRKLHELLIMINEMLIQASDMDAELSILINPSDDVINARDFTYNTLRNVEHYLTLEIRNRQLEQTV